ncbi:extracellular solute-binding protein, partial [Eisenbergiella porci]
DKLNMLLASGDYPEIIIGSFFTNADLVKYGTGENILIPLNDLIEENCVNLKARWEENPQFKDMMTTPDGNIYGIPSLDSGGLGHGAVNYKVWMNNKWLENVGMEVPETTEEFRAVLEAFKEQDANGNGDPNDEIPFSGAIGTWAAEVYPYLLNAFDYFDPSNGYLKLKNGEITGTAGTDGIKEGLKYIAGLYADGLIDPAALTQDESQLSAIGTKEEVICGTAACGHIGMFVDISDIERSREYDNLLPLEGPDGYRGIPVQTEAVVQGAAFVITDKCKHPEAAIKFADMFCGDDWVIRSQVGIKGQQWDDADEGTFGMDGVTPAIRKYLGMKTQNATAAEDIKWHWTMRLIEPNWKKTFQVTGDIADPSNYEARLQQCTDKLVPYAADADYIPPFFLSVEDATQIASMKTAIDDYVKASFIEFITGAKDVDKDWDSYLAGLDKLQYKEYIALNQKAYDEAYK